MFIGYKSLLAVIIVVSFAVAPSNSSSASRKTIECPGCSEMVGNNGGGGGGGNSGIVDEASCSVCYHGYHSISTSVDGGRQQCRQFLATLDRRGEEQSPGSRTAISTCKLHNIMYFVRSRLLLLQQHRQAEEAAVRRRRDDCLTFLGYTAG